MPLGVKTGDGHVPVLTAVLIGIYQGVASPGYQDGGGSGGGHRNDAGEGSSSVLDMGGDSCSGGVID